MIATRIYNAIQQRRYPNRKIFFIGFNKTATTSLHRWLVRSGIHSVHYSENGRHDGANLAKEIEVRIGDMHALRSYLSRWTAFSDLCYVTENCLIEANRHYALFHRAFPDAYFVLNDRDTDAWITSRIAHGSGSQIRRAMAYYKANEDEVIAMWRLQKERHTNEVLKYFDGYARFLWFRIDRDSAWKLAQFLSPTFLLNPKRLQRRNVSARRVSGKPGDQKIRLSNR